MPSGPVLAAAAAVADKKAERIVILDVSRHLVITDYFVISSGNTERQVRTIAEAVEEQVAERHHLKPFRREGAREGRWVLLDYVDFVVHVFHSEERDYYDLERLWSDAPSFGFDDVVEDGSHEPATAEAP
ncbi:MAG: ribosome silencing factor [Actinomycetota bacterium]